MLKTLGVYISFVSIIYLTAIIACYAEAGRIASWDEIRFFCVGLWLLGAFATPGVYIVHFKNSEDKK